ncbi:MAG TPA: TIGR03067 domain-containing protein [Haliangiales bacterium]|nr:TIGR03067 domain-containing protein [Haliangiales bacterium]
MKTISTTLLIVLAASAISLAWAEDNEATRKDMAQLQGEWSMVSGTADGFPIPDTMLPNSKRVCKGDELTATVGGQLVMKARITIDPSKKPKTIDYDVIDGPTKGKRHLGIYELDGDTFKSCFGAPGAERPTDFTSKPGDGRTSTVTRTKSSGFWIPGRAPLRARRPG